MKENVADIRDLQEMTPFFKSKFGILLGKLLIKWFCVEKVNIVHGRSSHLRGFRFTRSVLCDPLIDVRYKIHNEELLEQLPKGAFITVSNHPIGSLDGVILIDIFARRRPDFKVMVNGVLTRIWAMKDNFISVKPDSDKQGASPQNINGVRYSLKRLREGHPVGFFPSGSISFMNKEDKCVRDLPWAHNVIRLIRKSNVPVYPVYFDFLNSKFFYRLGRISWQIRTFRIPAEVFNKRGKKVDVYIGEPITPEKIGAIGDDSALAEFLYNKTYGAKK